MARTGNARPEGRWRVGNGLRLGGRARGRRPGIERLEGRLCLSATPPTWTSIGPAPITDPYQQNLNYNATYVNPPEITGAVQALATFPTSQGVGAYVGGAAGRGLGDERPVRQPADLGLQHQRDAQSGHRLGRRQPARPERKHRLRRYRADLERGRLFQGL